MKQEREVCGSFFGTHGVNSGVNYRIVILRNEWRTMYYYLVNRPNPLNREESKLYPQLFRSGTMSLGDISEEISDMSSVNSGDIQSMLVNLTKVMGRNILKGMSISLGDFGVIRPSLRCSKGAAGEADFNSDDIELHLVFQPSEKFKNELSAISFERLSKSSLPAGLVASIVDGSVEAEA